MVKNYLSILFLLIFVNALLGRTLAFMIIRDQLKKEHRSNIDSNNFNSYLYHCFKVKATNRAHINWLERETEFRLNGKCYDVVSLKELPNADLVIYCLDDIAETGLFKAYIDSEDDDQSSMEGLKNFFKGDQKYLSDLYSSQNTVPLTVVMRQKLFLPEFSQYFFLPYFDIEYPPEV